MGGIVPSSCRHFNSTRTKNFTNNFGSRPSNPDVSRHHTFELMLERVNKFPIEGMDELLKRRLQQPVENAISNCKKVEDNVKHSGLEDNKKYLQNLLSKIRSVADRIGEELNTFMFEVQLELIKKADWTSGNKKQLANKFLYLCAPKKRSYHNMPWLRLELAQQIKSYCNHKSLEHAILWILGDQEGPRYEPGTPEFNEYLGTLIFDANLDILERELHAKIAGFVEQPHIDGDGFMAFSRNFKLEWNQFDQKIGQFTRMDDKNTFRKKLDDLSEKAMQETASLKSIVIEKLDELITKCHNAELYAMKDIISGIGMFDGAAFNVPVRLEHEELDNDFCAELEKAVEQDKEMVSKAYEVKNVDE